MVHSCYLVITPDPTKPSYSDHGLPDNYWVKFGDGPRRAAYKTCNPDHFYSQNDLAPHSKIDYPTTAPKKDFLGRLTGETKIVKRSVEPGKWLEWDYIKTYADEEAYDGSEWHRLYLKQGQDPNTLRQNLCRMLELFPMYNRWVRDQSEVDSLGPQNIQNLRETQEFDALVQQTWSAAVGVVAMFDTPARR